MLCQLRALFSEIAVPDQPLDVSRGKASEDLQLPKRLLAPDPKIEQHGCIYIKDIVLVEVIVDQDGCVAATRLLTSRALPQVKEAALVTLKNWVYLPPIHKWEPVAGRFWEFGRVSPGPLLSFSSVKEDN